MNRLLVAALPMLIVTPVLAQESGGNPRPSWNASQTKAEAEQRASMIFGQLDRNQDGAITQDEIDTFTKAMGDNPRVVGRVTKMFSSADTNHDGKVSADEAKAQADAAFDLVDTNHDGVLTPEERQAARNAAGASATPQAQ
ncbi:EF-hand domain-containing protein [Sphingomonas crusticola]|uniref:EF-hand domain-containing protein n=1 Tax=Sphingomonas crusticola TaxID=1697973 RepID=UPI0013C2D291|nr:EF-hand domain-containing protein [Sphingomonas crusticola]